MSALSPLTEEELESLWELASGANPDGMGIKNKWIVRLVEEVRALRGSNAGLDEKRDDVVPIRRHG